MLNLIEGIEAARAAEPLQRLGEAVVPDGKPKPLARDAAKASTDLLGAQIGRLNKSGTHDENLTVTIQGRIEDVRPLSAIPVMTPLRTIWRAR